MSEPVAARKPSARVRELQLEVKILRAVLALGGQTPPPAIHRMIDDLVGAGLPATVCCRVLGVSIPGYYRYRKRVPSPTQVRRHRLTERIREIHEASGGVFGSRRVHAELTQTDGVDVSERFVAVVMSRAGLKGRPGRTPLEE